ncbi:toll-like receptor 4 [Mercenaria mercenaria]|uniref:toll-like receptor 4 n=1 Tax=Mercenaria mercenaria TaxID=6596 RepID=UPI00234EA8EB|nr:toll-like receptor 4 [Mercenaria mercenaria]XP_053375478.1 toll-like receptor 4 [Mercenaria mercenaria]
MHFQINIILFALIAVPQISQSYPDFIPYSKLFDQSYLEDVVYLATYKSQNTTHLSIHENCSQYVVQDERYINCSGAGVDHIPDLPKASFVVDLSGNKIEKIPENQFIRLYKLYYLDLSDNPLVYIDLNAFSGLSNLSKLYIRRSKLYKLDIYKVDKMLSCLPMLTVFAITLQENISLGLHYCLCPERISVKENAPLRFLTSVLNLEIDSSHFKGILSSTSDKWKTKYLKIIVTGYCFYKLFHKTCFRNVQYLQNLSISFSYPKLKVILPLSFSIVSFSNNTFDNNKYMESLKIQSTSKLSDFRWFIDDFELSDHLRNITVTVSQLKMFKYRSVQGVNYGSDPKFSLKEALSPLLMSKSKIESLDISNNGLIGRESEMFFPPRFLKIITAHHNCLSYLFVTQYLHLAWYLQVFDARKQNYCLGKGQMNMYSRKNLPMKMGSIESVLDRLIYTHSVYRVDLYELNFLRKIKYLDLSWNSNKLNTKVLRREFLEGLPNLEYFDLTGYTIEFLEENATFHKKLKYLNMTSNALWKMGCKISERFKFLPSLIDLRLSDNKISCLSKDAFVGLKAVQIIDLSKNDIENFEFSLKHLQNIRLLNLSNNNIRVLTKSTMDDLDAIPAVAVDLNLNKLTCNCESRSFLKWLQNERKRFVGLDRYMCGFNNNSFVYLTSLKQITDDLDRSCSSHSFLIAACSLLLAFVTFTILGGLVYRYRWKLRYIYYMSKIQIKGRERGEDYEQLFDFDAFISYASDDFEVARVDAIEYLEQKKSFRLCIHEREFQPGESIAYNISKGIHSSKRTLLFFSKSFLQSEWCKYELNIARIESMYTKRSLILVIMLEGIPTGEMTIEMMDFVKTYTYLEYPKNGQQEDRDVFWGKCADFINGS